jgi:hypothetical protein
MRRLGEKCLALSGLFSQGLTEPDSCVLPVPVGHGSGEPQHVARLLDGESAEQVKMGDTCRDGVLRPEPSEKFVQRQEEVGVLGEGAGLVEQLEPEPVAAPLEPPLRPRPLDQDAPHGLGGCGEEVPAIIPLRGMFLVY